MPMEEGIIILHGFGGHRLQTMLLARRLRSRGYRVDSIGYPSWRWDMPRILDHLHARIKASPVAMLDRIHFIGYSMGGLLLRAYLARTPLETLGRVVMLGTPNGGSEWAELAYRLRLNGPILNRAGALLRIRRDAGTQGALGHVTYPLGIIAGDRPTNSLLPNIVFRAPNDGKVSVAATHCAGQADHLTLPVAHGAMIYSRPVADQIGHFLRHGRFDRPAPPTAGRHGLHHRTDGQSGHTQDDAR